MEKRKFINICVILIILASLFMVIFLFHNISDNVTALNELKNNQIHLNWFHN